MVRQPELTVSIACRVHTSLPFGALGVSISVSGRTLLDGAALGPSLHASVRMAPVRCGCEQEPHRRRM